MRFKEDVIFSFEEDANKLTIFKSEGSKLVVISGAMAHFFAKSENQAAVDFDEFKVKFSRDFSAHDAVEVDRLFSKIKKTFLENELIS